MSASPSGRLIVFSGPSGVGKSSIVKAFIGRLDAQFAVSATTRERRPGEVQGSDYLFLSRDEFAALRDSGDILEWAEYGGYLYGTPRSEVIPVIERGIDVVLDIENEGAKQIRASYPEAVMIFIEPPSLPELVRRLASRGDTSAEDMERRLSVAEHQMAEARGLYDHIVVNDDLATAITRVLDILAVPADTP